MSRYIKDFAYDHVLDMRGVLIRRLAIALDGRRDTQSVVAEELRVSPTTISNIENLHYKRMSLQMLILLCLRLGVNYSA